MNKHKKRSWKKRNRGGGEISYRKIIDVGSGLIIATLLRFMYFHFFGMYPTVWESFNIKSNLYVCINI